VRVRENELAKSVVDAALKVHAALAPGLLESVYQSVLAYELRQRGSNVESEVSIPVIYGQVQIETAFRADLIVEDCLLIELKSIEQINPVHKKQLLTYLRLSDMKLGLLINFNEQLIKNGIHRVVNGL
jgi:GxxExxY protein